MGQLKSQSQPNNIIKCKYEIEDEEKNQAINVITEDEVEINKINIYYVKKFNNGVKKRIRIGRKQKFSEKNIEIIIIVDKSISIKSLKGLFKGRKHLVDVNDTFLDFPEITKDELLKGSNLDESGNHSPKEKPEYPDRQKTKNEDVTFDWDTPILNGTEDENKKKKKKIMNLNDNIQKKKEEKKKEEENKKNSKKDDLDELLSDDDSLK